MLFCVENGLYREYLKTHFATPNDHFIDYEQFAVRVAEDPQGILILQSDSFEHDIIDM
jgi:hypothetical protein